jgi:lysophospholipase L1-like esterase
MKNIKTFAFALAMAASAGCASDPNYEGVDAGQPPDDGGPPPVDAITNNPVPPPAGVVASGVRWLGRVDTTTFAGQPRFSWSGTGFVASFSGTSLAAELTNSGSPAPIFKAVVDGAPQAAFTSAIGSGTYMLATGLADGPHTVELYRQTEGPQGESRLVSLTVGGGGALTAPPAGANRLIEFIGDSITCGYGDLGTGADLNAPECITTESHWDTYAAIIGRTLNAEVSTIAASGRGIIRNYDPNDTGPRMPMLYTRAVANATTPTWDFHVEPQVVVINLGTNDISNNKGDPGDAFRDTYAALLATVRANYPHTYIIGIIGPLLSGSDLATIRGHIKAAVDIRAAAGDRKVEFFDQIAAQTSDKFACQYHPNVAENAIMADQLTAELQAKLGW